MISQSYGHGVVELGVERAFFRKRPDARCVFQFNHDETWLSGLQARKLRVCKMWPFVVLRDPVCGRDGAARWDGPYGRVYVYVDPRCPRIILGKRSRHFSEKVLPEFVDIEFGRKGS